MDMRNSNTWQFQSCISQNLRFQNWDFSKSSCWSTRFPVTFFASSAKKIFLTKVAKEIVCFCPILLSLFGSQWSSISDFCRVFAKNVSHQRSVKVRQASQRDLRVRLAKSFWPFSSSQNCKQLKRSQKLDQSGSRRSNESLKGGRPADCLKRVWWEKSVAHFSGHWFPFLLEIDPRGSLWPCRGSISTSSLLGMSGAKILWTQNDLYAKQRQHQHPN